VELPGRAFRASDAHALDPAGDLQNLIEFVDGDEPHGGRRSPAAAGRGKEIADIDGERPGDAFQYVEAGVHLSALDLSEMFPGTARELRKPLLAQPAEQTKPLDRSPDAGAGRAAGVSHDPRLFNKDRGPTTLYNSSYET
jgi:hypothetical protein